jgi:hypothetical protein
LTAKEIEEFLVAVPSNVVVVLDEAYNEYLTSEQRYDAIAWVKRFPNMILSRSFSKAYGLAGLRIGYGVAQPHLTDLLNRIRQPFNVNSLAQAAAIAAFQDKEFLQQGFELNCAGYAQLTKAFDESEIKMDLIKSAPVPSVAGGVTGFCPGLPGTPENGASDRLFELPQQTKETIPNPRRNNLRARAFSNFESFMITSRFLKWLNQVPKLSVQYSLLIPEWYTEHIPLGPQQHRLQN